MGLWEQLRLDMGQCPRVALVGGGGKTSILYKLAREALDQGRRVIVTTTTHLWPHPDIPLTEDPAEVERALGERGIVMFGHTESSGKAAAGREISDCLVFADVVLAEADGSRGLPLKAPAAHEPAVPLGADGVIAVAGLDCVGQTIEEACHRPEQVCALLGKEPDERLTPQDVAEVLSSRLGGRKSVGGREFRCALNKADNPLQAEYGRLIQKELEKQGIPSAITSFQGEERGGLCWF